jgi:hypothetical protein
MKEKNAPIRYVYVAVDPKHFDPSMLSSIPQFQPMNYPPQNMELPREIAPMLKKPRYEENTTSEGIKIQPIVFKPFGNDDEQEQPKKKFFNNNNRKPKFYNNQN